MMSRFTMSQLLTRNRTNMELVMVSFFANPIPRSKVDALVIASARRKSRGRSFAGAMRSPPGSAWFGTREVGVCGAETCCQSEAGHVRDSSL